MNANPMNYQIPTPPQPENIGKDIWKVVRLQLFIFLIYQIGLGLIFKTSGSEGFLLLDILPLVAHWLVLFILMLASFISSKKGAGFGYLISLLIIVVIGFGSCWLISGVVDRGNFL